MDKDEIKQAIQEVVNRGESKESLLLIEQYKKTFGYDEEILSMEAIVNIYNEDYDNAMNCLREGLKYNIFSSDLYYTMGNIFEIKGEYNRAYLCYEHSLFLCESLENKQIIQENIASLNKEFSVDVRKFSIVMLTYNQLKYTKLCISSIRKYVDKSSCEIIIVDNNSTDGTREWLKNQEDIKVIYNKENKGFPAGCNQGIEFAENNNDILLLNNDTILMPNSILNLRLALYSEEKIGATGATSNNVTYYQNVNVKYDNFDDYEKFAAINNIPNEEQYEQRVKIIGFAMLINRRALNKVGLLDERFTPGNFEDDDISFRILQAGYKLLFSRDSFIYHFGSVSFGEKPKEFKKVFDENYNKLREKWGFRVEYSTFIRDEIIELIDVEKEKPIRVLEIGCACGATLLKIKSKYKNAEIYGIELDEHSAKIAKCFADVRAENIENANLSYEEEFFDYIICADVLEHLYDPSLVLKNLKKYLKKDGQIIASIQNVMHYSVIKDLLGGNWSYKDSGILDRTHVRFFTINEIANLFHNIEYKINYVGGTNVGITDDDEEFISNLSKIKGVAQKELFMVYQYIVRANNK